MAGTSGCSSQFEELKTSDTSYAMGGSDESEYVTATASEADHATTSSSFLSAVEQIEKSKAHWSTLADQSGCIDEEESEAEVSNVEEFQALQRNPTWGDFFKTFGYDIEIFPSMGEMEVGEKFAEGGQAELYDAQITWWYPEGNEMDLKDGREWVLKAFKKGTFLKHLVSHLPHGSLQNHVEAMENLNFVTPKMLPRYFCRVSRGILLKDGRFAFLMEKEHFYVRKLIEYNME